MIALSKIMLLNTCVQNIIILRIGKLFIRFLTCSQGDKMENLLDVIEQFLSLSEEKLEELADKINYCVYKKKRKGRMRKFLIILLLPSFLTISKVVSTEKEVVYTSKEIYYLSQSNFGIYFREN